jgi:hypothetical protein
MLCTHKLLIKSSVLGVINSLLHYNKTQDKLMTMFDSREKEVT